MGVMKRVYKRVRSRFLTRPRPPYPQAAAEECSEIASQGVVHASPAVMHIPLSPSHKAQGIENELQHSMGISPQTEINPPPVSLPQQHTIPAQSLLHLSESDQSASLGTQHFVPPLFWLPNEIISGIFAHSLAHFAWSDFNTVSHLANIVSICRRLRDIAISSPALWTSILIQGNDLQGNNGDEADNKDFERLKTYLERSEGQLPLDVMMHTQSRARNGVLEHLDFNRYQKHWDLILPFLPRVRMLDIQAHSLDMLLHLFSPPCQLPLLEYFQCIADTHLGGSRNAYITPYTSFPFLNCENSSDLRSFAMRTNHLFDLGHINTSFFESYVLHAPCDTVAHGVKHLEGASRLYTLNLRAGSSIHYPNRRIDFPSLPSLAHLTLSGVFPNSFAPVENLESLYIDAEEFFPTEGELPSAKCLHKIKRLSVRKVVPFIGQIIRLLGTFETIEYLELEDWGKTVLGAVLADIFKAPKGTSNYILPSLRVLRLQQHMMYSFYNEIEVPFTIVSFLENYRPTMRLMFRDEIVNGSPAAHSERTKADRVMKDAKEVKITNEQLLLK